MRLSCRSQTSTVRLFPQCFLRLQADCVPRAEGCIAAACISAKPHRLYKDFKLIEELFVPLTQFQGFVSLRQDSFSKLGQTKTQWAHSGTWEFTEMHGLCIDRRRAQRFLKETHAFLSSHWWFLWVDPRSYSHQINAAKWNAPEIILDVCRSLYHRNFQAMWRYALCISNIFLLRDCQMSEIRSDCLRGKLQYADHALPISFRRFGGMLPNWGWRTDTEQRKLQVECKKRSMELRRFLQQLQLHDRLVELALLVTTMVSVVKCEGKTWEKQKWLWGQWLAKIVLLNLIPPMITPVYCVMGKYGSQRVMNYYMRNSCTDCTTCPLHFGWISYDFTGPICFPWRVNCTAFATRWFWIHSKNQAE